MRKELPLIITFITALVCFVPTVFKVTETDVRAIIDKWFIVMEVVMIPGAINLTRARLKRAAAAWLIASAPGNLACYPAGIFETAQGEIFRWIYDNILEPIIDHRRCWFLYSFTLTVLPRGRRRTAGPVSVMLTSPGRGHDLEWYTANR